MPYAWNATDNSEAGFHGGVAWYRKDFRLPAANASLNWIVRLESVNYHATVWINGHALGSHSARSCPLSSCSRGASSAAAGSTAWSFASTAATTTTPCRPRA